MAIKPMLIEMNAVQIKDIISKFKSIQEPSYNTLVYINVNEINKLIDSVSEKDQINYQKTNSKIKPSIFK